MRITLCDDCGQRVMEGVFKLAGSDVDLCGNCFALRSVPKGCVHEHVADGGGHGDEERRFCLDCETWLEAVTQ